MTQAELREWMIAGRVTPAELARRLGVTRQRVNALLKREHFSQYMAARVETIMADVDAGDRARLGKRRKHAAQSDPPRYCGAGNSDGHPAAAPLPGDPPAVAGRPVKSEVAR